MSIFKKTPIEKANKAIKTAGKRTKKSLKKSTKEIKNLVKSELKERNNRRSNLDAKKDKAVSAHLDAVTSQRKYDKNKYKLKNAMLIGGTTVLAVSVVESLKSEIKTNNATEIDRKYRKKSNKFSPKEKLEKKLEKLERLKTAYEFDKGINIELVEKDLEKTKKALQKYSSEETPVTAPEETSKTTPEETPATEPEGTAETTKEEVVAEPIEVVKDVAVEELDTINDQLKTAAKKLKKNNK